MIIILCIIAIALSVVSIALSMSAVREAKQVLRDLNDVTTPLKPHHDFDSVHGTKRDES